METKEYRNEKQTDWGDGPWTAEPDKVQFPDPTTGLPCLIVRNLIGALCGYVGVSSEHPTYGKNYGDVDVDVHGGLTFSSKCLPTEDKAHGICHVDPENDDVWWLGFDCGHAWDFVPGMAKYHKEFNLQFGSNDVYRDIEYVRGECARLAQQLAAMTEEK